jgi:hypothetical protein
MVALSDERDLWQLRIRQAWRAAFDLGFKLGRRAGLEEAEAGQARAWRAVAQPVASGGASYDELERRRWWLRDEQRDRETFGRPHPDDYPGRDGAA